MIKTVAQQVRCDPCNRWFYRQDGAYMVLHRVGHPEEYICQTCTTIIITASTMHLIALETEREPA